MRILVIILLLSTATAQLFPTPLCDCACEDIDREQLGRSTWYLLHKMVKHADTEDHGAFTRFMKTLSVLYPCPHCREHIKEYLESHPVEMSEKWMCEFHNAVNVRLNKPIVKCEV